MVATGRMASPALIEPEHVRDLFISGIAEIDAVGPCARFTLYVDCKPAGFGEAERQVVAKIVMPIDALPEAIMQAAEFLAERVCAGGRELVAKVLN